eukprot:3648724-Prymnesium_polylepis.1
MHHYSQQNHPPGGRLQNAKSTLLPRPRLAAHLLTWWSRGFLSFEILRQEVDLVRRTREEAREALFTQRVHLRVTCQHTVLHDTCLLYTSPSPRDAHES